MVLRVAYLLEQCWHRVPGGTATSALGTARALVRRDDVVCLGVAARHREPPAAPFVPPVEMRHLPLPRRALYELWHTARRPALERFTGPVDVVHATGMVIPPRRSPLVVTVHDLAFLDHRGLATRHGQRFFERSWALTCRDADLVLCPSEATRRAVVAHGFAADRTRVVPWGVDPVIVPDADVALVLESLDIEDPYVLTVGTIEPRKNLRALVAAMARFGPSGPRLVVAGPQGWNEDTTALFSPLGPRVTLTGFVDEPTLWALYRGAAVYCHPAREEGFGIPVLEALAAGAPVVVGPGTATEEITGDAGVVTDVEDPNVLAAALATASTAGARAAARVAGPARAAAFTWDRTAELTVAAYREVAR